MKINQIYYSTHFANTFRQLPVNIRQIAAKKEIIFRRNCFDKSLTTIQLKNYLRGLWSLKVSDNYTILFEFSDHGSTVGFIDIASHCLYRLNVFQ